MDEALAIILAFVGLNLLIGFYRYRKWLKNYFVELWDQLKIAWRYGYGKKR